MDTQPRLAKGERSRQRAGAAVLLAAMVLAVGACAGAGGMARSGPTGGARGAGRTDIERYIDRGWDALTRSALDRGALVDPKVSPGQSVLYVPADQPVTAPMRSAAAEWRARIQPLPSTARVGSPASVPQRPDLLYLPNPYVVPGGRFNEMYGWDSYFIVEGLLMAGRTTLAQGMTENFFYELDHYSAVLNANRTYYLTRSQPPFLTSMVLAVASALQGPTRHAWIAAGYAAAQKDWAFWNRPELRAGQTGLARYFDFGHGPVPEMRDDPAYYQDVLEKLRGMGAAGQPFIREVPASESAITPIIQEGNRRFTLTADFYLGDRAMRASGFDVSFRFGPYGGATHHCAPVCLNTLLYREEIDLAAMADELSIPSDAAAWRLRAAARQTAILRYLWDDRQGMFFDYDFVAGQRSDYAYAVTFYPLWAGLASPDQARRLAAHLDDFLKPGGIAMSTRQTGVQWDLPYGWAPLQLLTAEGLRRYAFSHEADDLSERWLRMIVDNFRKEGSLREKYNVLTRSPDINVQVGYKANVIGFGWTNGVFLKLLHELPAETRARVLARASGAPTAAPEYSLLRSSAATPVFMRPSLPFTVP